MNRHEAYRGGFTFMEVVVVISILILLMAILFPAFSRYRKQSRTVAGLSNQGQIAKGLTAYAVDHNNTYPPGNHEAGTWEGLTKTNWAVLLNNYMAGTIEEMTPPAEPEEDKPTPLEWSAEKMLPIFRDPNAAFPGQGYLHYSAHPVLLPDTKHVLGVPNWSLYKLSRLKRPGEVAMVMDGGQRMTGDDACVSFEVAKDIDGNRLNPDSPAEYDSGKWVGFDPDNQADLNDPIVPGANQDSDTVGDIRWRQGGDGDNVAAWKANFVFPDGHAATMGATDVRKRNIRVDE